MTGNRLSGCRIPRWHARGHLFKTCRSFVDGASMRCEVPRSVEEIERRTGFERIWACKANGLCHFFATSATAVGGVEEEKLKAGLEIVVADPLPRAMPWPGE